MKCNKPICTIGAILAAIAAVFFLVPLKTYKACKEAHKNTANPLLGASNEHSFFAHCIEYWKSKFQREDKKNTPESDVNPSAVAVSNTKDNEEADGKLLTTTELPEAEEVVEEETPQADLSKPTGKLITPKKKAPLKL